MSSKSPIFFGWWVVFAACFGMLFGSYSVFIGVSFALFVKPLEAAFEWTRTEISFALTLCTYTIVVLAPVIGDLIDRLHALIEKELADFPPSLVVHPVQQLDEDRTFVGGSLEVEIDGSVRVPPFDAFLACQW